jgi:hypothetical protein
MGFQNSAAGLDLGRYTACGYSLIRPPAAVNPLLMLWAGDERAVPDGIRAGTWRDAS